MKPHMTIRSLVVHPKDKLQPDQKAEVVYQILCQQCDKSYIGETGRTLQERLTEHKRDMRLNTKEAFTRSHRKQSEGEFNKSALTDHCNKDNHMINWEQVKILQRESDTTSRRIKEALTDHVNQHIKPCYRLGQCQIHG